MTETTELVKHQPGGELFVFARDPSEMTRSQEAMVSWSERKVEEKKLELKDLEDNLAVATKNKWRTSTLKTQVQKVRKKVEFYEKIGEALKAGYYIVPNMNVDIFAIRTTAKKPRENKVDQKDSRWPSRPKETESNSPPVGEGEYVSPTPQVMEQKYEMLDKEGKPEKRVTLWNDAFREVDFPFASIAKVEILEATAKAINQKVFDEIGIVPRRPQSDPMVIGTVKFGTGWNAKRISFLVAWFMDTKDI